MATDQQRSSEDVAKQDNDLYKSGKLDEAAEAYARADSGFRANRVQHSTTAIVAVVTACTF